MYLETLYFTGFSETLRNISGHPRSSFYSIRDAEVASSNLVASTNKKWDHSYEWFHFFITDFYNIELVISSGTNAVRDADGIIQKRH